MKKVIIFLQFIFILLFVSSILYLSISRPRILVVHSYSKSYGWSCDVQKGIRRVFKKYPHLYVRVLYMDGKKSLDENHLLRAARSAQEVVKTLNPHVVILVDDLAQKYIGADLCHDQKQNIAIVFAGVNAEISEYGYDKPGTNVTGILERAPLDQLKHSLSFFQGRVPAEKMELYLIGDRSDSVVHDVGLWRKFDWSPFNIKGVYLSSTYQEWKKVIQTINQKKNAIALVLNYYQLKCDGKTKFASPERVMAWTMHNANFPILSSSGLSVKQGCGYAVGASPFEQGEVAAQKAIEIVEGKKSAALSPIAESKLFLVYMNSAIINKYQANIPLAYFALAKLGDEYYDFMPPLDLADLSFETQGVI